MHGTGKRDLRSPGVMEEVPTHPPRSCSSIGKHSMLRCQMLGSRQLKHEWLRTHSSHGGSRLPGPHPAPCSPAAAGGRWVWVPRRFRGSQHPLLAPSPHPQGDSGGDGCSPVPAPPAELAGGDAAGPHPPRLPQANNERQIQER